MHHCLRDLFDNGYIPDTLNWVFPAPLSAIQLQFHHQDRTSYCSPLGGTTQIHGTYIRLHCMCDLHFRSFSVDQATHIYGSVRQRLTRFCIQCSKARGSSVAPRESRCSLILLSKRAQSKGVSHFRSYFVGVPWPLPKQAKKYSVTPNDQAGNPQVRTLVLAHWVGATPVQPFFSHHTRSHQRLAVVEPAAAVVEEDPVRVLHLRPFPLLQEASLS